MKKLGLVLLLVALAFGGGVYVGVNLAGGSIEGVLKRGASLINPPTPTASSLQVARPSSNWRAWPANWSLDAWRPTSSLG